MRLYSAHMTVSSILATAFSGLQASATQAQTAANNVVNANTPGYQPQDTRTTSVVAPRTSGSGIQAQIIDGNQGVDLTREFANLLIAETSYKANAQVIRQTEDLQDQLLDVIG